MKIIKKVINLKDELKSLTKSIGLVPTMGALHQGHLKLVEKSKEDNDITIVSIFVNQTQFNKKEDFDNYPKTIDQDLALLEKLNVDYVFMPEFTEMYPDDYRFSVNEKEFSQDLCGIDRPGHFDGVLTIVLKLFQLTKATRAYFGKKDYQQYKLISDMTKAFFIETKVVGIDTVREHDGLAMSSRNLRLTPQAREKAAFIYKNLKLDSNLKTIQENLEEIGFDVHYLKELRGRRFIAASINNIRLIDNVKI